MTFIEFKAMLKKDMYESGIKSVFDKLLCTIDTTSQKYNIIILLISEHRHLDNNIIAGVLDYTNENIHLANIRGRLLKFIDSLEQADVILEESILPKPKIIIGIKELPTKILLAMGALTPEIASERMSLNKELLLNQRSNFLKASEEKEKLAAAAYKKLLSLKNSNNKEFRLLKRYINSFADAFGSLSQETYNLANLIENFHLDFSILCLYKIEQAFANRQVSKEDFNQLDTAINNLQDKLTSLCTILIEKIQNEEALFEIQEIQSFGLEKSLNNAIGSKRALKKAVDKLLLEAELFHKGLSFYRDQMTSGVKVS